MNNITMSFVGYNKYDRGELCYNVSGKDNFRDQKVTEIKLNLTTKKEQIKFLQNTKFFRENRFNDF